MSILLLLNISLYFLIINKQQSLLRSYVLALIAFSLTTLVLTEGLSCFNLLTQNSLGIGWLIVNLVLLFILVRIPQKNKFEIAAARPYFGYLGIILIVFIITLITAVFAAPSTYDSMIYHLTRVAHWASNHNIYFYPTYLDWQNYHVPFAGYLISQTYILSDSDYFVNLVQWFAMTGSVALVVLICGCLKLSNKQKAFGGVLAATIPMGMMQATTTQNDYSVSFFVLASYYFTFCYFLENPKKISTIFLISLSMGLALLTKATAYLYLAPLVVLIGCNELSYLFKSRKLRKYLLLFFLVPVCINFPHWTRTFEAYHSILGPSSNLGFRHANEILGLPTLLSNIIRNLAVLLAGPIEGFNVVVNWLAHIIHYFLGMDINHPKTSWLDLFDVTDEVWVNETRSGNFVHTLLILFSLTILLFRKNKDRNLKVYTLAVVSFFLLFCLYLKSQMFHSRLLLGMTLLFIPVVAAMISSKRSLLIKIVFILSFPYLIFIDYKHWIADEGIFNTPRKQQYFVRRYHIENIYLMIADKLDEVQCKDVAFMPTQRELIYGHWLIWEYPLWQILDNPRIHSINVTNPSRDYDKLQKLDNFTPCAIFVAGKSKKVPAFNIDYNGQSYALEVHGHRARLYLPSKTDIHSRLVTQFDQQKPEITPAES